MFDPSANDMIPLPSSPTISSSSSSSSSDLDNESTGSSSFFQDRSTSLGALMGLKFPTITFPTPPSHSQSQQRVASTAVARSGAGLKNKKKQSMTLTSEKPKRWWWSLCRDEDAKPGSLREFLKLERRFYGLEVEGFMRPRSSQSEVEPRVLFSDDRVLPTSAVRLPVSILSRGI